VRGRTFTARDGPTAPPVVIVNQHMARRFWPDGNPVGRRIRYGGPDSEAPWMTVVGVVADMRRTGLDAAGALRDLPAARAVRRPGLTLVLRTAREPLALAAAARGAVRAGRPRPAGLRGAVGGRAARRPGGAARFSMTLLGTFARWRSCSASSGSTA
jgi:hypothetical protein